MERSHILNNIPANKLQDALDKVKDNIAQIAINRWYESNIPVEYWSKKMENDFHGDTKLMEKYQNYITSLSESYKSGSSFCLAGQNGRGKTFTLTSILKKACNKNYSCLYTTIETIVSALNTFGDEKAIARRELMMVDFLAIDEVDNRFFGNSEASNELFARSFETIVRTRLQNNLPVLMATNSPNIKESFASFFKDSLGSIMTKVPIVYVSGVDFRKTQ
jgi:DNA replication protein DnaC